MKQEMQNAVPLCAALPVATCSACIPSEEEIEEVRSYWRQRHANEEKGVNTEMIALLMGWPTPDY